MIFDSDNFIKKIEEKDPKQKEFHQAVKQFIKIICPFIEKNPKYKQYSLIERLTEPDRVISFRVNWEDDLGNVNVNRGFRVQFNGAIGPYKGGLRFDKTVNLSILKFLGFEQTLKNSLTTLPMGGAKGGADFNPKGKSEQEIMRFCYAFMDELYKYIGKEVDIPAGDIGVGTKEIGYLFGRYKKITGHFTGAITGKGISFGGSFIRKEATGYGCVYFAREILNENNDDLQGKNCIISGSGNVAQYTAKKLIHLGAKVLTLSDRKGLIYVENGISEDLLNFVIDLKTNKKGNLSDLQNEFDCKYYENEKPWKIKADIAFPCATQNELDEDDAKNLIDNNCKIICEGANMPLTFHAENIVDASNIIHAPGKASNAGGVAISGIELTQNTMRLTWTSEEVENKLQEIMKKIHKKCVEYGKSDGKINYVKGADIAGFVKVADAMLSYGVV